MKKVIRLTESDLIKIVKKVIAEQQSNTPYKPNFNVNSESPMEQLNKCLTDNNKWVFPFKKSGPDYHGYTYTRRLYNGSLSHTLNTKITRSSGKITKIVCSYFFEDLNGGLLKKSSEFLDHLSGNKEFVYYENGKFLMTCDDMVKKLNSEATKHIQ